MIGELRVGERRIEKRKVAKGEFENLRLESWREVSRRRRVENERVGEGKVEVRRENRLGQWGVREERVEDWREFEVRKTINLLSYSLQPPTLPSYRLIKVVKVIIALYTVSFRVGTVLLRGKRAEKVVTKG